MDTISPFFRSPFTDITGGMIDFQILGRCGKQEMDLMNCIEAYGLGRGIKKCKGYIDDYGECRTLTKQLKRFLAIRKERQRQIACGKLTDDRKYVSPRVDSY
ncbi:NADH dehydrogenase [ubiquinone] iron-sulfur protein 5-like [Bombyx mandarina]|uniref:Complex I-15 kDa n=2 Tax=Bombyx TaxID=7090 RepID=A0A8R2DMG9_BOMMO|nr:NADH dehydrogenase [ubiquinone] iron-sulfur protein 5 [Bombyx mori]XP_028027205.1 NADH dehydrogenase [ubiquinone] iron-sulfur protein 5-like [Bombyx mandarina]